MLFSALTDADMLDTEAWSNRGERDGGYVGLPELRDRLDAAIHARTEELAREGLASAPINLMRAQVLGRRAETEASYKDKQRELHKGIRGNQSLFGIAECEYHMHAFVRK
jgi:hypothetical protein